MEAIVKYFMSLINKVEVYISRSAMSNSKLHIIDIHGIKLRDHDFGM